MEPNYAPNVVNQTVAYGGKVWQGQPGGSWTEKVASPQELANEQRGIFMEAVKPAITSLESSLPEVQSQFEKRQAQVEGEKQPLKDRYDQLLNEIRGRETSQVNDTTRNVSREMGRRGIALSSTFAGDETIGRTAGIRSQAQSDILSTTFDRESKLREIDNLITNLNSEMVTSQRDIRNTIAQIQASAGTDAAKQAFQMYQIQQQQKQADLDRLLQERQIANQQSQFASSNQLEQQKFAAQQAQQAFVNSRSGTGSGNIIIGGSSTTGQKTDSTSSFIADKPKNKPIGLAGLNLGLGNVGSGSFLTSTGQLKPAAKTSPMFIPNPLSSFGF